jgi:hypothetical protein
MRVTDDVAIVRVSKCFDSSTPAGRNFISNWGCITTQIFNDEVKVTGAGNQALELHAQENSEIRKKIN